MKKYIVAALLALSALAPSLAEAGRIDTYYWNGYRAKGLTQARLERAGVDSIWYSWKYADSLATDTLAANATSTTPAIPVFGAKMVVVQIYTSNSAADSVLFLSCATLDTTTFQRWSNNAGSTVNRITFGTASSVEGNGAGVGFYGSGTPGVDWARSVVARSMVVAPGSATHAALPYIPVRWIKFTHKAAGTALLGVRAVISVFWDNDWGPSSLPMP